jgi:hypothetical protein
MIIIWLGMALAVLVIVVIAWIARARRQTIAKHSVPTEKSNERTA